MEFYFNFKMLFLKDGFFFGSKHDVPIEEHDDGQAQDQLKSKDVQKVLKLVRNQLGAQEDHFPILPSKSLVFLTLIV